jgi:hypothetical protein
VEDRPSLEDHVEQDRMRRTHAALLVRRCGSKRVKFTARIEPKEDNI